MRSKYTSVRGPVLALCLTLGLAHAAAADESDQQSSKAEAAQPADASQKAKKQPQTKFGAPLVEGPYVRRFSMGGSISVIAFPAVPTKSWDKTIDTNLSLSSKTESTSRLVGGGLNFQATLTKRLAVNVGVLMRRARFGVTDITYYGVDDTSTTTDERTRSMVERGTRATLLDIPVVLRYYTKNHRAPGRRLFYEAGVALRRTSGIHSIGQTTNTDDTVDCCDEAPLTPSKRNLPGYVVGFGLQMIDEFGIRFVPEFRYTHWMGRSFDNMSLRSQTSQYEFILSLTF